MTSKGCVQELPAGAFNEISKNKAIWGYVEFAGKLKNRTKFRRCIFTRLQRDETGQFVMDFGKPDNIIYAN